jgi:hypothetical protein
MAESDQKNVSNKRTINEVDELLEPIDLDHPTKKRM